MLLPPGEGVNGIFDAYPKVVNTPQVVETNVNMCPMNSFLQIPRPPLQEVGVGARLMHFVGQWEEMSVDTYILEVVRSGYCLEFKELPPPTGVIHTSMPGSIEKVCVIEKEILTLLQKNAIEKVPENEKSLGFYSTIFLTKKKSGGLRPILNLSNLNLYLQRFHFRMETLRSIIKSLQQGGWTIALDLTDAYFHVPIRLSHRRYLRFCFNGQCYQYRALPFGLSTAPRLFTKVVQVIAGHLRQESIHCHQYLDDWLLKNKSRSLLLAQAQKAIDITVKLGFLINKEKSNLLPSQSFVYLGAHFDLKLGRVFLTQERSVLIQDLIGLFRLHEYLPAQTFLKLLGTLASCIDVIPYVHLHMRPIQMYLLFYWKPSQRNVQSLIPVSSQLISHLEWWTIPQNLFRGVPLSPPSPDMVLTTDASKSGWGTHLDDLTVQGVWSSQEQQLHINNLELLAVRNALHHFCTLLQGKHVLVKSDNSTVIAYINNQGGTKSTDLCMILWHLMQWCIEKGITLTTSHIPGVKNTLADVLSRKIFQHTEWSLNDSVLRQIFAIWGSPSIDLFASDNNHKIPVYCSLIPSRRALSGDALVISWSGILGYAYPPIALLSRVLQKVKQEECTLILIAPLWPKRPWFPLLLDLLIDFPIEIPLLDTLLVQPRTRLYHPAPEVFNLTAWLISSSSLKRKDFLSQLASFWHQQCDRGHRESISTSIDSSYVGVINGMRIPFNAASLR